MDKFDIVFIIALSAASYITLKSYHYMTAALEAKRIQKEMVTSNFWESQKSFEE